MIELPVALESRLAPRTRRNRSTPSGPSSPFRPGDRSDATSEPLSARIAATYREMPGLSLTLAQAARLWSAERNACGAAMEALVVDGRLRCTRERRFGAAGDIERVWRSAR